MSRLFDNNSANNLSAGAVHFAYDFITAAAWVKPTALGENTIVARWTASSATAMWILKTDATGKIVGATCDTGYTIATGATTLAVGVWQHIAMIQDATGVSVFYNGKLDGSAATQRSRADTGAILYLGRNDAGDPYNGELSDVALWNISLGSAGVARLAQRTSPERLMPGSVQAYWPLKEPGDAPDRSSHAWKATQSGTVALRPTPGTIEDPVRYPLPPAILVISPPFVTATTQLFTQIIVPGRPIAPPFVASATTLYTPSIVPRLAAPFIASATVLYTPTVRRSSIPAPLISTPTQVFPARLTRTLTNVTLPSISGTAQQGQTLVASPGTWSGTEPVSYAYQWRRCNAAGAACANIGGATASNYVVTAADVASTIRVEVTASY